MSRPEGLYSNCTTVEVLRQRALSGELPHSHTTGEDVSLVKASQLTNSHLAAASSSLAMVLRQACPLLQLSKQNERYVAMGIKHFFHFLTASDSSYRLQCLSWLMERFGQEVTDCYESLTSCRLLEHLHETDEDAPWDRRLMPGQVGHVGPANRLSIVLDLGVWHQQLVRRVSKARSSVLSLVRDVKTGGPVAVSGIDTELLQKFENIVQELFSKIVGELSCVGPLEDWAWDKMEDFLVWYLR